jgi:hypothetical protein
MLGYYDGMVGLNATDNAVNTAAQWEQIGVKTAQDIQAILGKKPPVTPVKPAGSNTTLYLLLGGVVLAAIVYYMFTGKKK